jgi:hypothetical protein
LKFFGSVSVGEKTVIANPHKSAGKGVEEESAEKLHRVEAHGALSILVSVILVAEGHFAVVDRDQPLVRNSDSVGVAGKVFEHLLGTAEGRLGVDDPIFVA